MGLALLLVLAAGAASAQSPTEFATGVTSPGGGLVLNGTFINPATGQPTKHLWTSDQGGFGMCRLDPDVDTPGPHFINGGTCIPVIDAIRFKPGQFAFDPATNNIYAVDLQANSRGIFRLHYLPSGNSGLGSIDPIHFEVLGGNQLGGRQTLPGCGIAGNVPNSAVLGPDGNLYIGFKASGDILRVVSPQTEPLPCANVQVIGSTADGRKDFGLGWIGHDLFGGDGLAAWVIPSADQCLTPQNGNTTCHGTNILVGQTATPSFVMSDQIYPALNGRNLYVANPSAVTLVDVATQQVTTSFATGFEFLSGMAQDPTNMNLYVADDPTNGVVGGFGRWWALGNSGGNVNAVTLLKYADGVTAPSGGTVLIGAGINPNTGKPYRHLWSGDQGGFGLCRLDPDIDSPGPHVMNATTCMPFVAGVAFKPGSMAFDPITNNLYTVDMQANTKGVFRLHFIPTADGGHGSLDIIHQEVLASNGGVGRNGLPGCGIAGNVPNSAVLGPDGNLYVGFKQSGDILRITAPAVDPVPCTNVQVIGTTPDSIRSMGLGWIGHDLFGGDGRAAFIITNADQCMSPANGQNPCHGNNILQRETAAPTAVISDQMYPALNGRYLLVGQPGSLTLVNPASLQVTQNYVSGFQLLTALALDPTDLTLFVADDISAGKLPQQGHWWQAAPVQVTPAIPGAPLFVQATAEDAAVLLNWTPFPDGQAITSYTVHANFSTSGVPVPDVVVTPPAGSSVVPTTVTVSGLINNSTYAFVVSATNDMGTSRWSLPSRFVSPFAPSVPKSPTHVSASSHDSSATVAWTSVPDYLNGGFRIITYRVEVDVDGVEVQTETVPALQTSVLITGLTNGTPYTFVVYATNELGDSPKSSPSNMIFPSSTSGGSAAAAPTGVTAVAGNASAQVSWTAPTSMGGSPVTGYLVHVLANGLPTIMNIVANAPHTSLNVTGLNNGTHYTFQIQSVNAFGVGPGSLPSNSVVPVAQAPPAGVVPGVPTGVTAVGGTNSASVTWTAPANSGSSAITNYNVIVLAASSPTGLSMNVAAPALQVVVGGLTAGVNYSFQVHAISAAGDSGASATSNVVTPSSPAPAGSAPSVPTSVVAVAGKASASIAWTAPASNGGQPITSYTVVALLAGVSTNQTVTIPAPITSAVMTGLTGNGPYTFVVHAINSVGDSGASAPSNALSMSTPVAAGPDISVILAGPASVPAGSNANFTITVTNGGGAPASDVTLTHSFTFGSATLVSQTVSQGSCLVRGAKLVCDLGGLPVASSATLNVTLQVQSALTNRAVTLSWDLTGRTVAPANPTNGMAKLTTAVTAPASAIVASAQIANPAVAAGFTGTQAISNTLPLAASAVQSTHPSTLNAVAVTMTSGVDCTVAPPGAAAADECGVAKEEMTQTLDSHAADNLSSTIPTALADASFQPASGSAVATAGDNSGATGGKSGDGTLGGSSSITGLRSALGLRSGSAGRAASNIQLSGTVH